MYQSYRADGNVPFVASGNFNNGIVKWCEPKANEYLDSKGCISISPLDGSAFYQPRDFLGRGGAGSAIILLRNEKIDEYNGLYICTILRAALSNFSYNDQLNSRTIGKQVIKLPSTKNGEVDYDYMHNRIERLKFKCSESIEILKRNRDMKSLIDVSKWGTFHISDLFRIVKGTRLTRADMKEGNIRFIGASSVNNGITAYISNNEKLHPANTMTVSYNGSVGETFYQDKEFWASDDVNVLYPKFELTRDIALFIALIIKKAGRRYEFINKWKKEDMEQEVIKLPVDIKGNPDFKYMGDFIKEIWKLTNTKIKNLH